MLPDQKNDSKKGKRPLNAIITNSPKIHKGFQVGSDWTRACFTPDSEYITVGAANGKIFIWSVHDNSKPETVLSEHTSPVLAAAWQPAGNSLTTCDKNKTVVVWAAI